MEFTIENLPACWGGCVWCPLLRNHLRLRRSCFTVQVLLGLLSPEIPPWPARSPRPTGLTDAGTQQPPRPFALTRLRRRDPGGEGICFGHGRLQAFNLQLDLVLRQTTLLQSLGQFIFELSEVFCLHFHHLWRVINQEKCFNRWFHTLRIGSIRGLCAEEATTAEFFMLAGGRRPNVLQPPYKQSLNYHFSQQLWPCPSVQSTHSRQDEAADEQLAPFSR